MDPVTFTVIALFAFPVVAAILFALLPNETSEELPAGEPLDLLPPRAPTEPLDDLPAGAALLEPGDT